MFKCNFDKMKEVVTQILEKSISENTSKTVLEKDIKIVMSYITFAMEKRVESLSIGLNKTISEKESDLNIEYEDVTDLRRSFKTIFSDFMYDIKNDDIFSLVESMFIDMDRLFLKILNKMTPLYKIKKEIVCSNVENALLNIKKYK